MLWKSLRGRPRLLWVILPLFLSACGGGNSDNSDIRNQDFLSRILISGDSPSEPWDYIWNCQVDYVGGDSLINVPLRFYRDGNLTAGMGDLEVNGSWDVPTEFSADKRSIVVTLELENPSPELFLTEDQSIATQLFAFEDGRFTTTDGTSPIVNADAYDEFSFVSFYCIRYTPDGALYSNDVAPVAASLGLDDPNFLSTGQANPIFVPDDEPTSDDPLATAPSAPAATPSPEQTPATPPSEPVSTPAPSTTSASSAPLSNINSQVESIWYIGDYRDTVMGLEINYSSVIEFTNREVSRDGETISNEGIAESKRKNPDDWGEGRIRSGLLSYKWGNSRSWQEPFLSSPTTPYPRNQKIRGCYRDTLGIQGPGSTPTITRLCLSVDGTFNLGSNGAGSGTYLIEGFAIRLSFSGGERAEFLMGAHKDSEGYITALIIGDRQFRPD